MYADDLTDVIVAGTFRAIKFCPAVGHIHSRPVQLFHIERILARSIESHSCRPVRSITGQPCIADFRDSSLRKHIDARVFQLSLYL